MSTVAKTDGNNEPVLDVHDVDELLAVKNWAMQSPDWRLLNLLIDMLNEEQLQYKCSNKKSVFVNFSLMMRLALTNPEIK